MPSFVRSGPAFNANSQTASSQTKSSITALADGGFVVVWQTASVSGDGSGSAVKLQRYTAAGVAVGAETLVNAAGAGDQTTARVAALNGGGFVVTWETSDPVQDGSGAAIKARLFDAGGMAVGGEFLVNTQAYADQKQPTVTGLADGGFVVAWYTTDEAADGAGWALKAQRFSAAGAAVGNEFRVNNVAFGGQWEADIASLANGGFIVTWQTGRDASSKISGQAYSADGLKAGGELTLSSGYGAEWSGRVVGLANGGFAVTWTASGTIWVQTFDAARSKVGAATAVSTSYQSFDPDIAALADGTFVISWGTKFDGIQSQTFNGAGQKIGVQVVIANDFDTSASEVAIAALSNGTFVTSWTHKINGGAAAEDIRVQLLRANEAPELGAATRTASVLENLSYVGVFSASDSGGPAPVSYAIAGGADAARFTINAATGSLSFAASPNFEAPTDADRDNVYQVIVRASDGELSDVQTVSVTVVNQNESPTITSNGAGATATITLAENVVVAAAVTALDPEGVAIVYSISGGADAARFAIDAATGALTFVAAPDFEAPADADRNNVYLVTVRASDGVWADTQALSIAVGNANEAPTFTSGGGAEDLSITIGENGASVATVSASDPDGDAVTYSIAGGADAALFTVDGATGAVSFVAAPDFETPGDVGGDNGYELIVRASSGGLSDTQRLLVTVTNRNETVAITSNGGGDTAQVTAPENSRLVTNVVASDADGDALTYAIAGGADAARFSIDAATGALSFVTAPNFEAPGDVGGDGVYDVVVSASDGTLTDTQTLAVTLGNVNEGVTITTFTTDTITSGVGEGIRGIYTIAARDEDGDPILYSLSGADAALFSIDAAGLLSFVTAPDFEAPHSADGSNSYRVTVTASDGTLSDTLGITYHVFNINERVAITSLGGGDMGAAAVSEGATAVLTVTAADPDGDAPTFSIAGGADAARFAIDAATGALRFVVTPDHETPADADGDNVYEVQVAASDGPTSDQQTIRVTVGNVNERPTVVSNGGGTSAALNLAEGVIAVTTVVANDADGPQAPLFSITGGPDADLFTIDAATGALSFLTAPDFEAPADSAGSNFYTVVVSASDGELSGSQSIQILVGNINEGLSITSAATVSISENATAATVVAATDIDGDQVTYSIAGGVDAAAFEIDAATGQLRFRAAPNFEAPTDADGDNVYELLVSASDGQMSDTQALSVSVTNRNEGFRPDWADGERSVAENRASVGLFTATDIDGDAVGYAITGGADAARFTIDAVTGALSFVAAANFEAPGSAAGSNSYRVAITASDGAISAERSFIVTVTNENEGVTITSGEGDSASVSLAENGTAVTAVAASDGDGDAVSYRIAGGRDAARFAIDAQTGALSFVQAPNFEAPADVGGDNSYEVVVEASDGVFSDSQTLSVRVADVNEPVAITSNGGGDVAAVTVAENGRTVTTVAASDVEGVAPTYAIVGGADAARFVINAQTGALSFVAAPNHEAPTDAGANNVYDVIVSASDGVFIDTQALAVTVSNVREGNTITGTSANNTISTTTTVSGQLRATELEDTIYGLGGADTLSGAGGADIIDGGVGNDVINGGLGADLLTGGTGADRFVYTATGETTTTAWDVITDFRRSESDRIDLGAIDARTNASGNQNFTWIGGAAFSRVAGQLRFEQAGGVTFVLGDVNGDGVADFRIELTGAIALTASDFVL